MMITPKLALRLLSAAALLAIALGTVPACKREKPNANRDLQKNQSQYMDEMDAIAKKIEAEEKAKQKPGADAPAKEEQKTPAAPGTEPKKDAAPADKAPSPGGG